MATPQEVFARTLEYIEQNLEGPVSLEALTGVSGLSRFQLIRLFSRLCGRTPIEYVRARKLARSIPQLIAGDRILDIALDWGFEHEQSYIRAFRDAFRITPARFRRQEQPIAIVDVPRLEGFTVSASGMLGRPSILARPAFALEGVVEYHNYADNLLDGTPLYLGMLACASDSYIAACRPAEGDRFAHAYLVASKEDASAPVRWHWPAGQWAQFTYIGLHPLDREGARRVRLMASLVVGTWFNERGRRWDGQFIEHVERRWLGPNYCEVELLLPLDVFARG